MPRVIRLYQDMTFEEKTIKAEENNLKINKDYNAKFKLGVSVFKERPFKILQRVLIFWKKRRNLFILLDGCPSTFSLEPSKNGKEPALNLNFGSMTDTTKFIHKVVAKSKAEGKPMSNTQFMVLALLVGAVLMFQFMIMKGVTI